MQTITAQELKEKMAQNSDLMVINALAKDAYDNCHIKGSISVPLNSLQKVAQNWNKDAAIVVYCASKECQVSTQAYNTLKIMGFTNVLAYEGGIQEWQQKGFPCGGACARLIVEKNH